MKYLITVITVTLLVSCHENHILKEVKDRDGIRTITVDVSNDSKRIYFKKDFDIRGMDSLQKKSLTDHLFDSLGVR